MSRWVAKRSPGEKTQFLGRFGEKKAVIRVDGVDYVFVMTGFSLSMVRSSGGATRPMTIDPVEVDGIWWSGYITGGGQIQVIADGVGEVHTA